MPISVGKVHLEMVVRCNLMLFRAAAPNALCGTGTLCTVPQAVSSLVDQQEPIPELQFARCMSNRYRNDPFPRCVSCTRRWAGDTCRFQGIRFLLRDSQQTFVGVTFVDGQKADTPNMALPGKWNVKLERHHLDRIMVKFIFRS